MFKPKQDKSEMIRILKKHKDFSKTWMDEIERENIAALENSLTITAKKMANRVREVQKEYHRQRSFLRFENPAPNVFSANIYCKHNIEVMILKHMKGRFPKGTIILYSTFKKKSYVVSQGEIYIFDSSLKDTVSRFSPSFIDNPQIISQESVEVFDEIEETFKVYYESQYIENRWNPTYFNKFMTKENLKSTNQKIEQAAFNHSLDRFVKPKKK